MKHFYLKSLFLGILFLTCIKANAYDCYVDGIYYDLDKTNRTASVVYNSSDSYKGAITIPSSFLYDDIQYDVKTIAANAFYFCRDLSSIIISNSVTSIAVNAFYGCSCLTSVKIGNGVTNIGNFAFSGCIQLKSISIGNSVKTIGNQAFSDCRSLSTITIPNNVISIGNGAFSGCESLSSLSMSNSVSSIESYTFKGCKNLDIFTIPNSVTTIKEYAFYGCNGLVSITISSSVTAIGEYAFSDCLNLETIKSEITNIFDINTNVFIKSNYENVTLFVPNGLTNYYMTKTGWNSFKNIKESDASVEPEIPNKPQIPLQLSCNSKGTVTINDNTEFTNKISSTDILEDAENTFVFIPKVNCKLEQVCLNGFDITLTVENNTLKAVIPANSQMVVTFAKETGDLNNDGNIDISDVVSLINMILGQ